MMTAKSLWQRDRTSLGEFGEGLVTRTFGAAHYTRDHTKDLIWIIELH